VPLLLAVGSLWLFGWSPFDSNHFRTAIGGLQFVPLADGSRVTLNTDSDLRIVLTAAERKVELNRGEAFFEVATDPRRPFVVDVGNKRIVAVGTAFSVFHQGKDTRVNVTEGTVRVEDVSGSDELTRAGSHSTQVVLVRAGAVAQVENESILVRQTDAATVEQSLSWRSGILTFRDRPLNEVVAEFNRYNSRHIVIEDPAIASLQLGGVFRATNLDPFIELLEQTFPIRARPDGDRIVLTHN
jgi:transmembrane sensor